MDYNEITNRIDELNLDGYKHIKNNDWHIPKKLIMWLNERDFTLLGDGAYSKVFKSPTENFVVKINDGMLGYDENYTCFAEYCYKNKSNPHLPKVGKIKEYGDWFVIFIEKLDREITPKDFGFISNYHLKDFFKEIGKHAGEINNSNGNIDSIILNILNCMNDEYNDEYFGKMKNKKQLIDICLALCDFLAEYNIDPSNIDLHSGNFMMRGDTIVMTDPVM